MFIRKSSIPVKFINRSSDEINMSYKLKENFDEYELAKEKGGYF